MLIEPASKVSVPFTVVMRIRSKAPPSVITPEETVLTLDGDPIVPDSAQIFPDTFEIVTIPL